MIYNTRCGAVPLHGGLFQTRFFYVIQGGAVNRRITQSTRWIAHSSLFERVKMGALRVGFTLILPIGHNRDHFISKGVRNLPSHSRAITRNDYSFWLESPWI